MANACLATLKKIYVQHTMTCVYSLLHSERFQPLGIREHASFVHTISSREQAELEFKKYCPHDRKCYLTWWNDSSKKYELSVSTGGKAFRHFNITTQEEGCDTMYEIEGSYNRLNDVSKMLNLYKDLQIGDIDGIGDCFKPFMRKSMSEPGRRDDWFQTNFKTSASLDDGKSKYQDGVRITHKHS